MNDVEQRLAAKEFAAEWQGCGYEKGETHKFWIQLMRRVLGVADADMRINFEDQVKLGNTSFIDARIPESGVLIEQKGSHVNLDAKARQSDGAMLTPLEQAQRYVLGLPLSQHPRYIVVCNFTTFQIYDCEKQQIEYIQLEELPREYHRLGFLIDPSKELRQREMQVSLQAGIIVGKIYDALLKQYINPESPETLHSLNALCVRLVFCLYAEDAGIFGAHSMFHDYLHAHQGEARNALINLFRVLDTKPELRDPYMDSDLAAFPYVNGGLFADDGTVIPRLTPEIVELILQKASADFDWSMISPTIFGAVFESTLNPVTRRSGGMHYTSIENIHKVIDPLFLDALRDELAGIRSIAVERTRMKKLAEYQKKMAGLTFLDPACGSGNFLTETYLSLRRLENEVISLLNRGQGVFALDDCNPIKVSIGQFYGIEINDFAVSVARAALWIAESQMLRETESIVRADLDFLPLKSYVNIVEGNALRMDWDSVVPKDKLNYIMGNPPFVGYSLQSKEQKADMLAIYADEKGKPYKTAGKLDYVAAWYFKSAQLMQGTDIRAALVATNSITQGEQVAGVWLPLYNRFNIHMDFAHRTFRWDSEASLKAHVHCVVIGFSSSQPTHLDKFIYEQNTCFKVQNINPYLIDAPNVWITSRSKPLCKVPSMLYGNKPVDGGNLMIEHDELESFLIREPKARPYIRRLVGAKELINGLRRWCLWLPNISPAELRSMPAVMERVQKVKEVREKSPDSGSRKLAEKATTFRETKNPDSAIVVPRHSSEKRYYIPIGYIGKDTVVNDAVQLIPDASLYHFGIVTSSVHMAWTRATCGRIKSDYRYSKDVVYNNYPWPHPTEALQASIEKTAQGILDARALYPDSSLADLYDEVSMPPELRRAHQKNDRTVMQAYGFAPDMEESVIVAELMKMYQFLTEGK